MEVGSYLVELFDSRTTPTLASLADFCRREDITIPDDLNVALEESDSTLATMATLYR